MIWRVSTFLTVSVLGGWLGYSATDRALPTVILEMHAEREVVAPGDQQRFRYKAYRLRTCYVHVDRFIFDAEGVRHVLMPLDFAPGILPVGEDSYSVPANVPLTAAEGPAMYRTVQTYECNFMHRIWPMVDGPRDIRFTIRAL